MTRANERASAKKAVVREIRADRRPERAVNTIKLLRGLKWDKRFALWLSHAVAAILLEGSRTVSV
jgi:hypothetical protein